MWELISAAFPLVLIAISPLLVATVGGRFSVESDVSPLALEGFMINGSFFAALSISLLERTALPPSAILLFGLLFSLLGGALISFLHAYPSISCKADQIISAVAVNMFAFALYSYYVQKVSPGESLVITTIMSPKNIPLFEKIPILGPLFFMQSYWSTWLAFGIWIIAFLTLRYTRFGLRLRAVGSDPLSAHVAGFSSTRVRYIGVLISGALAGLGGGILLITYQGVLRFGVGLLAVITLRLGGKRAFSTLWAVSFFGIILTVLHFLPIPYPLARILFFVVAFAVLVVAKKYPAEGVSI